MTALQRDGHVREGLQPRGIGGREWVWEGGRGECGCEGGNVGVRGGMWG